MESMTATCSHPQPRRRRSDMGEKMTLEQVRDTLREESKFQHATSHHVTCMMLDKLADAIDAHLATPVQTVDVDRKSWIDGWMAGFISTMTPLSAIKTVDLQRHAEKAWSDKLSQAIGDKT